jgi:hypothetical protein
MPVENEPAPAGPTTIPEDRCHICHWMLDKSGCCPAGNHAQQLVRRLREVEAELARERRRTASLVKAGDELIQHCFVLCDECYDDSGLGIMLCKACRLMRERWNQAKSALAGPGGDETANGAGGTP